MEEKIMQIIEKVRSIGKYNIEMKELVSSNATVKVVEQNRELVLEAIYFYRYDTLTVTNHSISLTYEHGNRKVLFKHNGWDELLKM